MPLRSSLIKTMNSMIPSSSNIQEPVTDRFLSVRFEDSCVLIPPGPTKSALRPRIITKSYSLPLWKTSSPKKNATFQSLVSELNGEIHTEAQRKAFSLTLSVPSLTTKSRPHRSIPPPSPSCLSKRNLTLSPSSNSCTPSSSPTSPPTTSTLVASPPILHRRASFPKIQPAATLKQAETIPLRPCCEACHSRVDAALAEGESWSTQWSRGAVRRYSEGEHVHLHTLNPSVFGVTRVWTPQSVCDDPDGGNTQLADALTIDEVDVKRRSGEHSNAILNNHHVPPSATEHDGDSDVEDVSCETTNTPSLGPVSGTLVLQEENEDMLFPLPSPRRTPNHSPTPTPTGSQVKLPTLNSGSHTNVGLSGSQLNPTTPTVSSPLASQDIKSLAPVPCSPPIARPPPLLVPPAEPAPNQSPPRSLSSSPVYRRQRASSPESRRPRMLRRSSFSSVSETFLRGSTSVLKGVAAGMKAGAGGTVGVMR